MAKQMTDDILKHCYTEAGYASIKDVKTLEQFDSMESFFFAETLKYAYLVFAPETTVDLSKIVFNTEAHPFNIESKKP
jgi:mannosidase alpha-like ER degradation enhancer 2